MKKTKIIYWIFTGLMAALIGVGGVFDLISAPEAVAEITRLGYPVYLIPFLGVAKLAAIVVLLIPGFRRIKEWAYAGLVIDLVGALYSHVSVGDAAANWFPIVIILLLVVGSYIFYHKLYRTSESDNVLARTTTQEKVSLSNT